MPNYDDLFTGQPTQQEEKPFDKTAWAARKQAEREGVYAMIDSYVQDSKLYGACCRIGFVMGYDRIITYTLASETGASLRAAGFTFDGIAGGRAWTGQRRRDYYVAPAERKHRWMKRRVGAMP